MGSDPRSVARRPKQVSDRLGQVLTPPRIAQQMAEWLMQHRPEGPLSILDPAVGPGTFPLALLKTGKVRSTDSLTMYDLDRDMLHETQSKIDGKSCFTRFVCADYLEQFSSAEYDLVIMNPPYIRQEWIDKKELYHSNFSTQLGLQVPGTSNLYIYFVAKVFSELKSGGRLACILYDSWKFTKFGVWLRELLQTNCHSVDTIPAGEQPFWGRLIDATIVRAVRSDNPFRPGCRKVYGHAQPNCSNSWTGIEGFRPIEKLFETKRGLRLKQANFFMIRGNECAYANATPFLKKTAKIKGYRVDGSHEEAALLLHEGYFRQSVYDELMRRLELAKQKPQENISILTWLTERPNDWFIHRKPPVAPLLFNYYLRGRPKHVLNSNKPYSDNFYGLNPRSDVEPLVLLALLNSTVVCIDILSRARNQGSGLVKIQLYEYRATVIPDWRGFSSATMTELRNLGQSLASEKPPAESVIYKIDSTISREMENEKLHPDNLWVYYEKVKIWATKRGVRDGLAELF